MATRTTMSARSWSRAVAFGLSLLAIGAHDAPAQSPVDAAHDLQTSDDFRVRVSAALTLGRAHSPGARALLEQALADAHPAVRIAASAALGALGDPGAVPALRGRLVAESSPGVRSQITSTIDALGRVTGDGTDQWQSTRYVVAIGDMHNRSQVTGTHAVDVLRSATQAHAKTIPGVMVADNDPSVFDQAAARHVPVFMLDGALQRLSQTRRNAELSYSAQVDYSMRRVPQQQLRGVLSGSATSFGSVSALHDPGTVTLLEDQAIDGAVESALRGAARGFGEAAR